MLVDPLLMTDNGYQQVIVSANVSEVQTPRNGRARTLHWAVLKSLVGQRFTAGPDPALNAAGIFRSYGCNMCTNAQANGAR